MAARDRSERVRGAFLYMAGIGAVLLAIGGVVNNMAYLNAADDFAAAEQQSALPSGDAARPGRHDRGADDDR